MKTFFLWVMAILYMAAGLNHFRSPATYRPMMPPYLPDHEFLIQISGAAEFLGGLFLLFPLVRRLAAWGIILLLIAVFPANLYMLQVHDSVFPNIPTWVLIARLPLQLVLVWWARIYTKTI